MEERLALLKADNLVPPLPAHIISTPGAIWARFLSSLQFEAVEMVEMVEMVEKLALRSFMSCFSTGQVGCLRGYVRILPGRERAGVPHLRRTRMVDRCGLLDVYSSLSIENRYV